MKAIAIWLFVAVLASMFVPVRAGARSIELIPETNSVGLYETLHFRIAAPETKGNPFDPDEVNLEVEFKTPSGSILRLPAFFGQQYERVSAGQQGRDKDWCYPVGPAQWQARFAPTEPGAHEAKARWRDSEGAIVSGAVRFDCRPSARRGFLRVSRRDPRFIEFSSGEAFFGIGQNLAFIGNQQYVTLSRAEEIFGRLRANGANYLRIWTGCEDWAIGIEARKSAWGRSWGWNPPFAACPDNPNRRYIFLGGDGATVRADPSHRVALRPNAEYALGGKVMVDGDAAVLLTEPHANGGTKLEVKTAREWTSFKHTFKTQANEFWLIPPTFRLQGKGKAWLDGLSLTEAGGGPELLWEADANRPVRGAYNQLDCFLVDELVESADRNGIYLQLCLLTRDLYMKDLKNPASVDYDRAIADAKKFMRYAVARWGSATSVAAWEYWNELDPGLPTDRFYTELGQYLDEIDVYHHLRTTSTWGPSAKDCKHPMLDLADTHFYLRPSDQPRLKDEVEAVLDRTRWLREQAQNKPIHLGEFGIANEKWQPTAEMQSSKMTVDFHNALWASALSGAATTALFWWWDRLDRLNHYGEYGPLSRFVADIPWTTGLLGPVAASAQNKDLRIVGLRSRNRAWLWLFDPAASWGNRVVAGRVPSKVEGAVIAMSDLPEGTYELQWFDTRQGQVIRTDKVPSRNGTLEFEAPAFTSDIALVSSWIICDSSPDSPR